MMYNGKRTRRYYALTVTSYKLVTVFCFAHKLLPAVGQFTPSVMYLAVCLAALAFVLCSEKVMKSREIGFLLMAFSVSFLVVVRYLLNRSFSSAAIYMYGELQTFLYGAIVLRYIKYAKKRDCKKLLKIIAACYLVTAVTTYIGCTMYPNAARIMATLSSSNYAYRLYTSHNIGGFSFIYELILIMPLVIYLIKSKKINVFAGSFLLCVIGAVILKSEYMIATFGFCVLLVILPMRGFTLKKMFRTLLVFAVCVVLLRFALVELLTILSEAAASEVMAARLKDIASLLGGGDAVLSGRRMELYVLSLKTFLKTKGIGGWGHVAVGGHSFILDTLGIYGIFGALGLVAMYFAFYKIALEPHVGKKIYPYICWIFCLAVILAFLNPKTNFFILACVIPLFAHVFGD